MGNTVAPCYCHPSPGDTHHFSKGNDVQWPEERRIEVRYSSEALLRLAGEYRISRRVRKLLSIYTFGNLEKRGVIHRPPGSGRNKASVGCFLHEFSSLLEACVHLPGHLLVIGDFNIHVDQPDLPCVTKFHSILKSNGLQQHVSQHTHKNGHILDLIITRAEEDIKSVEVVDHVISDHLTIQFELEKDKVGDF